MYKVRWYELGNGRKCELQYHLGENTIKRAKGTKVEVFFQGLHMTCVIFVLVITLNLVFQVPPLALHFKH